MSEKEYPCRQTGKHPEMFEAYYWADDGVLLAVIWRCLLCGLLRYEWTTKRRR